MAGCTRGPRADRRAAISCDLDAIRAAITDRTRAIVTVSPNNPSGAVYPEAALREVNALCRERGLYHIATRSTSTSPTDGARTCRPDRFAGAERPHDLAVLAVEGVRLRRLAHRLHGVSGASRRRRWRRCQDTILVCPPVDRRRWRAVAALEVGRAYCEPHVRDARRDPRHRHREAGDARRRWCTVPPADGAFYCLLRVNAEHDPMRARRAADSRAQGGGDSRARRSA